MSSKLKNVFADYCIIGGGSGGLSLAAGLSQMGIDVVLVEKDKMGGECLNTGCVPSKSLIHAASFKKELFNAKLTGWQVEELSLNFVKTRSYIDSVIEKIRHHDSEDRFTSLGVKVIKSKASFVDNSTIQAGDYTIRAKKIVLATGSHPFIPPINGLVDIDYWTNENIFKLQEQPQHLVVIGGGPIGLELAQSFLRLGSKVTVLEAFNALPKDEPDVVKKLTHSLCDEGLHLKENLKIKKVTAISKNEIQVDFQDKDGQASHILCSHILLATGRRPNLEGLNLEKAGVKFSSTGVIVNKNLRTSNKAVYAIGDCIGGYQFTHIAAHHASMVIRNSLFKLPVKLNPKVIPWVTYTDPELAHVGYTTLELDLAKIKYKLLKFDWKNNDRAATSNETLGEILVKVNNKGNILGTTILGRHAGELIFPWVMAITNNLTLKNIINSIAPYPTLSEVSKRVAGEFYTPKIYGSKMKKIVKILRKFL